MNNKIDGYSEPSNRFNARYENEIRKCNICKRTYDVKVKITINAGYEFREYIPPLCPHCNTVQIKYKDGTQVVNRKKGYIQVCSIGKLHELDLRGFTKKLLIVRKVGNATGLIRDKGFVHVPQLSPSEELFNDYKYRWLEGNFTQNELDAMEKGTTHTWWDLYLPRFIEEMRDRGDFQKNIKRVMDLADQGINVLLVCFCPNLSRCHRMIIGYFLQKKGYEVRFR